MNTTYPTQADLPAPTTPRETDLLSAVDLFLQQYALWVEAEHQDLLTDEFQDSLLAMVDEFAVGDMPGSCRDLDDVVRSLGRVWAEYEEQVSQQEPMPRSTFWEAVERLAETRRGQKPWEAKPLESVAMLHAQGVTHRQIALMYSYSPTGQDRNRVGPFWRNGVPQDHLVEKELQNPGSVIPADFVHPADLAARQSEALRRQRRLQRIETLATTAPVNKPPESIEELLRQGVSVRQIAKMHGVSVAVVLEEAKAREIRVTEEQGGTSNSPVTAGRVAEEGVGDNHATGALYDPDEMQVLDEQGTPINGLVDGAEVAADEDGPLDAENPHPPGSAEHQIVQAHLENPALSALAIARKVKCTTTTAAAVLRDYRARTQPEPATAEG